MRRLERFKVFSAIFLLIFKMVHTRETSHRVYCHEGKPGSSIFKEAA